MEVSEQEVHEFESPDGDSPFDMWLTGIPDVKTQAKIRARILRVRIGNLGAYKGVGEGVLELVLDFGPGYRVYLARIDARNILLLGGGDKKTQPADIMMAKIRWSAFKKDQV